VVWPQPNLDRRRLRCDAERRPMPRVSSRTMKIINNINRRPNLLRCLRQAEPDIVCVQELKAADAEFPAQAIRQAGYHVVWRGTGAGTA
jgi:mRNA deadenylase 3'-5' endonuclease subunit Ccr4